MMTNLVSYHESSTDGVPREHRLVEEIAQCERAVAELRERRYVVDRDVLMRRVYESLIRRHRRTLAELRIRRPTSTGVRSIADATRAYVEPDIQRSLKAA